VTIKEYLKSKKIKFRKSGDNYVMNCLFCPDNTERLGIHIETGSWHCFNCDRKGKKLRTFKKEIEGRSVTELNLKTSKRKQKKAVKIDQTLAEKYHRFIYEKERKCLSYLMKERGFEKKTINHFQLGSNKKSGYEFVSIPFWRNGQLVNIKFRAIKFEDKKWKWRRIKGGETSLFHDEIISDKEHKEIFITEAELDCVSLYNSGIKNVVSVTAGAGSFKQEWYERLERFKKIYLVFDSDVDGQAGAKKIAERLGLDRCFNIELPKSIKDVNKYFWNDEKHEENYSLKDFLKLKQLARRFEVRNIMSLKDTLKEIHSDLFLADEDEIYGFETPWSRVNKIMGGAKKGYLVIVSSPPKIGKTTFVLNWMLSLSKEDVPTLLYCCEMRGKRLGEKVIAYKNFDFTKPEEITEEQLFFANDQTKDNVYFGYPVQDKLDLDNVCDDIKNAVKRYGIKFVVFDNLHFLVRNENVTSEVGNITRRFKLLAETLNIVFVLVVHPRKIGHRAMDTDDFKDSSSIWQDADIAIMLHRDLKEDENDICEDDEVKQGHFEDLVQVKIAGRWGDGGKALIAYEGQRSMFHETGSFFSKALQIEKLKKKKKNQRRNYEKTRTT